MKFLVAAVVVLSLCAFPTRALAWEWLRSENQHVHDGNARMRANDAAGALRLYDLAARELPSEAGVHLNRGLALLAANELDRAREALLLATDPPATAAIRSAAHYNLGLAFYRQADAKAGENDHQEAQRIFREAADSFRRSLRLHPGNRDAAWNLELALRRIQEQQQQQEQQEQQQQQQEQQQQNQDQQNQDPQDQDQQNQDQQNQDPQNQDQQNQDQQDQGQEGGQDAGQGHDPNQQQNQNQNQSPSDQPSNEQQNTPRDAPGNQDRGQNTGGDDPSATHEGENLPGDVARVLDSLEDGEENLERMRARVRAMRENRRPQQDW